MASSDYLKKYLSNDGSKSDKKKKSKKEKNYGGMKVIEDDTFIMVKPKSRGMPSDEELDETEEEVLQKQKLAENMKFLSDTFEPVDDLPNPSNKKNGTLQPRRRRDSDGNSSPQRRRRHDSGGDVSPQRRRRRDSDRNPSPPRRRRHDSGGDASPPRRRRHDSDKNASPPRRRRHDSDRNASPPRRRRNDSDRDASPPRRRRHDSGGDVSPQRRRRHDSDKDASPPRRRRHDSGGDASPPRRRRHDSDKDASPPRRRRHDSGGNVSPQRKLQELDLSGQFAETKVRMKYTGKNRKGTKDQEEKKAREEKKNDELKQKYEKWNRGVTQLKQREEQLKEEERVMKEGFSRYADDEAMNDHLKDELLPDDPMAALISKKREKVELRKGVVYPTYKGHWPPNRYNIAPGYRWDGVNRSNGFEAQLSLAANKRKADEEASYRSITECAE